MGVLEFAHFGKSTAHDRPCKKPWQVYLSDRSEARGPSTGIRCQVCARSTEGQKAGGALGPLGGLVVRTVKNTATRVFFPRVGP